MTIEADKMKDAPEWATRYETIEGDEGSGWYAHYLTDKVVIKTAQGDIGGRAELVLDGSLYVADHVTGESWGEPAEMRKLAAHLLNAADGWEAIRNRSLSQKLAENFGRCLEASGMDIAGLADRTEVPADRIEAVLAGEVEMGMTELALFAFALDVNPGEWIQPMGA